MSNFTMYIEFPSVEAFKVQTQHRGFIFISFVLWVDRGACHHIRGGETGGAREEADSQMFLWKSQAQDMGQLKFTMHWLM